VEAERLAGEPELHQAACAWQTWSRPRWCWPTATGYWS
jgi:hypothetical protein